MNRKCIKVVKTNNYKGLCIRHTFVKRELTNEEMQKLELLVEQKMPQLKNQTVKTIKRRFAFYNLHSQGDLYGM